MVFKKNDFFQVISKFKKTLLLSDVHFKTIFNQLKIMIYVRFK